MNATISYKLDKDIWQNGKRLAQLMQSERIAYGLRGYFFHYSDTECLSHKVYSKTLETNAGYLMQAARDTGRKVRVFKNMNGQIAASLA